MKIGLGYKYVVVQQSEIHKPRENENHQIWQCFNALATYKNKQMNNNKSFPY